MSGDAFGITISTLPLMSYWRRTRIPTHRALVYTLRLEGSGTGYSAVLHCDEQGYLDSFEEAHFEFYDGDAASDSALAEVHVHLVLEVEQGHIALPWLCAAKEGAS